MPLRRRAGSSVAELGGGVSGLTAAMELAEPSRQEDGQSHEVSDGGGTLRRQRAGAAQPFQEGPCARRVRLGLRHRRSRPPAAPPAAWSLRGPAGRTGVADAYTSESRSADGVPVDSAAATGKGFFRAVRSDPSGFPVSEGSPQIPRTSSTSWKAMPRSSPNLAQAATRSASAPAYSAPSRHAHAISEAVLPLTILRHSLSSHTGVVRTPGPAPAPGAAATGPRRARTPRTGPRSVARAGRTASPG